MAGETTACGAPTVNLSDGMSHVCELEPGHEQPHMHGTYWWETASAAKPEPTLGSVLIATECDRVKALLMQKNEAYGNQLLEPRPCFSRASALERIDARIDEKLARISNVGPDAAGEDTVMDLVGLLIVRMVAKQEA